METLVSVISRSFYESFVLRVPPEGKGSKASKVNYRGIALFPTLCKICEMVLLNRLENHAVEEGIFSDMQLGFKEGVGCNEASFTILETINHMEA